MTFNRKTPVPLSVDKRRTASGMRALAGKIDDELPGMAAPQHLRDAARALESGNHTGAKRHLQAAMHTMTPLSLTRHGVLDDDGHAKGKINMDLINRHHMLVSDLEDGEAHNQGLREKPATFTQPSHLPMGHSMDPLQIYGSAQTGGPGYPKTVRSAMAPAPAQNTGTDRAVASGPKAPDRKENQLPGRPMPQAVLSWADVDDLIELSAQTARLAATPAPRGRPGGPGLYDVKGMGHTDYLQQIVKALIEKRGMEPGKAYAIARGAIRRWASGGGKVHPEVRAASAAAESGELARQARAHAHTADTWAGVVELVGTAAGAAQDPRNVLGQFGSGGQPAPAQSASQASTQKAQLLAKAKQDRAQALALTKQLIALQSVQKKTAKKTAQATKAGSTGKSASSTPAKTTSAAPAVKKTTAAVKKTTTATAAAGKAATPAQQIKSLKTQIAALLTQAAQATAMAAKL